MRHNNLGSYVTLRFGLYDLAHFAKDNLSFLWNVTEQLNATLFAIIYRKQQNQLDPILNKYSGTYCFRIANIDDTNLLVQFFAEQPKDTFEFFQPHGFDEKSIRKVITNKSFLTFIVSDADKIVGYFFLRCFVNGKGFRGKVVDYRYRGKGIAKQMGIVMTETAKGLGIRVFGSISPKNMASLASARASNEVRIVRTLENGYYYIEFTSKK